jgi:putative flippase GtrA
MKFLKNEKLRYLLVGGYNTAFGYILFVLLLILLKNRVHYLVVLVISHVISVTNAYLAYKFLVFKTQGEWLREFGKFNIVYLGVLIINLVALPVMVEWLSIKPAIGQAWFVLITIIVSYLGHKHFSFKTPGHNLITTSRQVPFRSLERHK